MDTDFAAAPLGYTLANECRWITLLLPLASSRTIQTEVRSGDVILRGGWLFDSIHDGVRRNTGILVRNGAFLEVDAESRAAATSAPLV